MQLRNLSPPGSEKAESAKDSAFSHSYVLRRSCPGPMRVPVLLNRGLSILLQRPEVVACDGPAGILPHADLHTRGGAVGRGERARNFP